MATRSLSVRSICGENTWKLFLPRSLAWYIAVSECLSSSPMVAPSRGNRLTPMLTVATSARPSIITGADSTSLMRVAAMPTSSGALTLCSTTTNSSPPMRTTMSAGRTAARTRLAISCSSLSPTSWPRESLMCLKRSRSRNSTASICPVSWQRAMRLGQVRLQEQAVRQARQVIVIGELVEALLVGEQLRLRLLSLRQVAHEVRHQAAVARFDGHAAHFDVHLAAVLEPLHELDAAARLDARQRGDHRVLRIVRTAQHRQHRAAAQFVQRETELLLHGRIGIDDLAGARVGDQQSVLRLFDDGAVARLEREAVGVEAARARHEQHGDDGEAADQQAEQDGLVERRARRLRVRAARDLELHQPDGRAHLVAQDQVAVQVAAARHARRRLAVSGEWRTQSRTSSGTPERSRFATGKPVHRPGREAAHAFHDGRRERTRESDPAMRLPACRCCRKSAARRTAPARARVARCRARCRHCC